VSVAANAAQDGAGNNSAGGNASVSYTAPAATSFTVAMPSVVAAGSSFVVTVTAKAASNDTAFGYVGTVHLTSSDGQALLPSDATLANGVGTFIVTLKSSGSQSVTASDSVATSITGSATASVTAGTATHYSVSSASTALAGAGFLVSVAALDSFNN